MTGRTVQTPVDRMSAGRVEERRKRKDDPFYSESNMAHLMRGVAALNAGKGVEHEIIPATDE